jgi:membrane protease YdiL (CAAX protease family)
MSYAISAGIFEETLVRGYLMTEMIALGKPVWLATIASIVLQTSYHVYYGFAGALSISGLFIVFAVYFAFSRRLGPVILAHSCWDVAVTLSRLHH